METDQNQVVQKGRFERGMEWMGRQFVAVVTMIVGSIVAVVGGGVTVLEHVADLIERWLGALRLRIDAILRWLGARLVDPFYLRVYGDTLLTTRTQFDHGVYTLLLIFSGAFELFAWSNMWGYTGVEGTALKVLPVIFAGMVILLDRGILVMDDPSGRRRWRVIGARVSMLVLLAFITAIPVEMRVFAPEIDRVIANAEKVKVDQIRETAKAYETDLEGKRVASAESVLSTDDIATRREKERQSLLDSLAVQRKEVTSRLNAKTNSVASEVAYGGLSGRPGNGSVTAVLRGQENDIRNELLAFNTEAAKQLAAFDKETEAMRTAAVQGSVDEHTRLAAELDEKLHAIEVMPAEELAAAYGGEYKEPNGFLARYRTLLAIVAAPDEQSWLNGWVTRNSIIVWGCRLIMVMFGLVVLFIKFAMKNPETTGYYSLRAQALSGNDGAVRVVRTSALAGDPEAVSILRLVAQEDPGSAAVLRKLGFDGNVEVAGWNEEVVNMHQQLFAVRANLVHALGTFRQGFRTLCHERSSDTGFPALPRDELVARAQSLWHANVTPVIREVEQQESALRFLGANVPAWPQGFEESDPRVDKSRLWLLSDEELKAQFGWENPDDPFRGVASA